MKRLVIPLAVAALLSLAEPAAATIFRGGGFRPMTPLRPSGYRPDPNHMPGWDWRRTYPWSPYNYGRNPYNPIILPPYNPYPYYPSYGPYYDSDSYPSDGATYPTPPASVQIPQPTGVTRYPPPDAAIIRMRVPGELTAVSFDGQRTYTVGTTRYFVTPDLQPGKTYSYEVTATTTRGGGSDTQTRTVKVTRGHTTVVDFTRPAAK